MFQWRRPGFTNIDSDWNRGPSPTLTQSAQAFRDDISTVIVKTQAVNQCSLFRQPKDAWPRISRLSHGGHGPDLNETEPHRLPCRQGDAVLVQPGREADRIRKGQTKQRFWVRRWCKSFQCRQRWKKTRNRVKRCDREMMSALRVEQEQ